MNKAVKHRRNEHMKKPLIIFLAICIPSIAFAQQDYTGPMRFSTFWPCSGNGSYCGIRILAEGTIQPDTGKKLELFLRDRKQHKHELPPTPTIVFSSLGGSVLGGMALGRVIRKNRLDAELEKSYSQVADDDHARDEILVDKAVCASACIIAFSGGVTRTIQPGTHMGIHQFSGSQGSIGDSATQITVVLLADYFKEMGIKRAMLDKASLTPSTSIYWVSDSEAKRYKLDNTSPHLSPWKVSATAEGDAFLEVLQEISFGRYVYLRIVIAQDMGMLTATTVLDNSVISINRSSQFPENEKSAIDLCTQIRCIQARSIRPWLRRETNTLTIFETTVALSLAELNEIARANQLGVTDGFSNAISDVSLSTDISTEGLSPGVALLLKQK